MNLYNLKHNEEQVSFTQAVKQGLGKQQGLFFPDNIPAFDDIDALLDLDFHPRCAKLLAALLDNELTEQELLEMVTKAFIFPAPLAKVSDKISALELFHGPTLAFKDFGGRFMAQCLAKFSNGNKTTILTATSGDTGAAVAHAFYGMENINVVVLYPKGKISPLQEKLFCTLGGNITTVAVEADFDACQAMVKQSFDDEALKQAIGLNSANSINISRLVAQVCYYFEAAAQLSKAQREQLVVSVPSGNFGNLTAGLIAKAMGLPIKRFIAATNANDTVPRYLASGNWEPKPTQATLSNAMDVSQPNNWPRVEELFKTKGWPLSDLGKGVMSDAQTAEAVKALDDAGYVCEPHGAIAYQQLTEQLAEGEQGLFLCTAHPAKFKESVEEILGREIGLPKPLADRADLALLSKEMPADFAQLRELLMSI
ncbi:MULTISPECIES: threonine synthase [unclassified Agarivorans]|uniref:threonine synthase n=1 Tax=unclassified Agarivorans TaxID=2636026 RepID=UPI0026E27012|nr:MULTISPECIES: threonine synthase [unclassified Agarivorans]MDO6686975.1 threonine synthase [Agarivorans sp. 3_MG-2023]MDO6716772.1 threonine synthase [Agarivorans sp. 2_MG-2023]